MKANHVIPALLLALGLTGATRAVHAQVNCAIETDSGFFVTAVGGGGRTSDVLYTNAPWIQSWERFTLIETGDENAHYGIQTVNGFYLTAVGGGGRTTEVIYSNATTLEDWEKFSFISLGSGWYAIQTINGHYLTAVDGGGRTTDSFHSDATEIGPWEMFRLHCGL